MSLVFNIKDGDWSSVRQAIAKLGSLKLGPTSTPTFAGSSVTGLTTNSLLYSASGGTLTSLGAATNGQLPIGSTDAAPVLATLTPTANQINIANAGGSITFSTPQDIHATASNFTVAGATVTGASVVGLNSAVFQPAAGGDSTTFMQVKNATGAVIGNWDTTNKRVGIGTNAPGYALHVLTTDSSGIMFEDTGDAGAASFRLHTSTGVAKTTIFRQYDATHGNAGAFAIEYEGNDWISVNDTGVGINVANAAQLLQVVGSAATNATIKLTGDYGSYQMVARGGRANNVNLNIRPLATSEGYIKYSHEGVADRWSIGIEPSTNTTLYFRAGGEGAAAVATLTAAGTFTLPVFSASTSMSTPIITASDFGVIVGDTISLTDPNFPVGSFTRDTTASNTGVAGAIRMQRTMGALTAQDNSGVGVFLYSENDNGDLTRAGMFGGMLPDVSDGAEIGAMNFAAAWQDVSPSNSYHLTIVAKSTASADIGINEIAPETVLEITDSSPYFTLHNSTHEDSGGGRESRLIFKGEQSGEEETTLFQFEASHDGAADDQLGKGIWSVNTGAGLVQALEIGSDLLATFAGNLVIPDAGMIGSSTFNQALTIASTGNISINTKLLIGSAVAAGTESIKLDLRANTASKYIATFEQDSSTGWGVLIDTDSSNAGDPAFLVARGGGATPLFLVDSTGNVGIKTATPTLPLSTLEKSGMTPIGGFAIKLTNKTGESVAGQLVAVYSATGIDDAVKTAAGSDDGVIGITLDAGIADGSEMWVVVSGIADVLMDGGGSARGDRIISSGTAGSADVWNVGGAVATHFQEIGHCIETRTGAGLARCILHFN